MMSDKTASLRDHKQRRVGGSQELKVKTPRNLDLTKGRSPVEKKIFLKQLKKKSEPTSALHLLGSKKGAERDARYL